METAFFLASNSGAGFYSLYDSFPGEGNFLHIIKGGPGTGKSSFMRAIAKAAQARGMDTELILCSADPNSLDGLYIPALKRAWVDGTAPHVREPGLFGISSDYVNLGVYFKGVLDKTSVARAEELNKGHKKIYRSVYAFLSAEAAVARAYYTDTLEAEELQRVEEMLTDILSSETRCHKKYGGRVRRRFISAVGSTGKIYLEDTIEKLCKQNYCFNNPCHAHQILSSAARIAAEMGLEMILCPEPLCPEHLEALLLPELGLCFSAANGDGEASGLNISFGRTQMQRESRQDEKLIRGKLRGEAVACLAQAKALHDELEMLYKPQMDFEALTDYTQAYIKSVFG